MKKYFLTNKSFEEQGVATYQELWNKVKSEGYGALEVSIETVFTKAEDEDNKFHAIFSTASEDRHGDIVRQSWDIKAYKKNPVFIDSHDYSSIDRILGKIINLKSEPKLEGDVVFALSNPRGVLARDLTADGFLNATSVGFIPKEFGKNGEILSSELLEVSGVSVPANAQALFDRKDAEDIVEAPILEPVIESIEVEVKKVAPVKKSKSITLSLSEVLKHQRDVIEKIALELKAVKPNNTEERRRKLWRGLRSVLKEK